MSLLHNRTQSSTSQNSIMLCLYSYILQIQILDLKELQTYINTHFQSFFSWVNRLNSHWGELHVNSSYKKEVQFTVNIKFWFFFLQGALRDNLDLQARLVRNYLLFFKTLIIVISVAKVSPPRK